MRSLKAWILLEIRRCNKSVKTCLANGIDPAPFQIRAKAMQDVLNRINANS